MSNWLQAQLKAAEGILEAVDRTVSKTVYNADLEGLDPSLAPLPDAYNAYQPSNSPSAQPTPYTQLHTSPFTEPGPFSVPPARPPPYAGQYSSLQAGPPSTGSYSSQAPQPTSTQPAPAAPSPSNSTSASPAASPAAIPSALSGPRPPAATAPAASPPASTSSTSAAPGPSALRPQTAAPSPPASLGASLTGRLSDASAQAQAQAAPAPAPAPAAAAAQAEADDPRVQRSMEQLRQRVERLKYENHQLEEMLANAEEQGKKEAAAVRALQQQYARLTADKASSETAMEAAITAKSAELTRLALALEASQLQSTKLEALLAASEEASRVLVESKEAVEGGMLEALRSQLLAVEQRLEVERREHHARQAAASQRTQDLEQQLADNGLALASAQRSLEELGGRSRELEELLALAESARSKAEKALRAAPAGASQEVQSPGASSMQQNAELAALRQQVTELRHHCQQANQARQAAEGEAAKLQQQVAELQQHHQLPGHSPARGSHPHLEQQLKEMGEMLYIKQTQLEKMAADKAAQQLVLERQVGSYREELARLRGGGGGSVVGAGLETRGSSALGYDVIPMDALGEPYQRLARHNRLGGAVQATAKFLDNTAASTSIMLRQYPLARLLVFAYVVLIHLYVYFLIARMQRQALGQLGAPGKPTLP